MRGDTRQQKSRLLIVATQVAIYQERGTVRPHLRVWHSLNSLKDAAQYPTHSQDLRLGRNVTASTRCLSTSPFVPGSPIPRLAYAAAESSPMSMQPAMHIGRHLHYIIVTGACIPGAMYDSTGCGVCNLTGPRERLYERHVYPG